VLRGNLEFDGWCGVSRACYDFLGLTLLRCIATFGVLRYLLAIFFSYSPFHRPSKRTNTQPQGSVMLIKASSEEEVREWIANDEYVKGGAWDVSKMTIVPFRCAVRTAM
jgi:hypothetical protein